MIFAYKGINNEGRKRNGFVYANSSREAVIELKRNGIIAIYYLEKRINHPVLNKVRKYTHEQKNKFEIMLDKFKEKREKAKIEKEEKAKKVNKSNAKFRIPTIDEIKDFLKKDTKTEDGNVDKKTIRDLASLFKEVEKDEEIEEVIFDEDEILGFDGNKREKREGVIDWKVIKEREKEEHKENLKIKTKPKEILMFTKQLRVMLASEITIQEALINLSHDSSKAMKQVIEGILEGIQEGERIATSFSKFPKQFDTTYIALLAIGEDSGEMPQALEGIAKSMEKQIEIKKKIRTASIYPAAIGIVIAAAIAIGSIFLIPAFEEIFDAMTNGNPEALPWITRFVFGVANKAGYIIIGVFAIALIIKLLRRYVANIDNFFIEKIDKLKLTVPALRDVFMASYMYNIASTVALMVASGINLYDTVNLAKEAINNVFIQYELATVSDMMIEEALPFSESIRQQKYLDNILASLVHTGEESGEMEKVLTEAADYYEGELNSKLADAMELVQPVSITLIAIVVIPVVFAVFLPMLDIQTSVPQ